MIKNEHFFQEVNSQTKGVWTLDVEPKPQYFGIFKCFLTKMFFSKCNPKIVQTVFQLPAE